MLSDIQVDTKVSLVVHLENADDDTGAALSLGSFVEGLDGEEYILIHMPMRGGYYYPMPREPLLMRFVDDSDMYALWVQFEDRVDRAGFPLAKMRRLSDVEPHQQRDCFRLDCTMPVVIERLWQNEEGEAWPAEGRLINLSDGGALFATNEDFIRDEELSLSFDAGARETVECVVLRKETMEGGQYLFKAAVRFKTDKRQANRLYKYIVKTQLERRRR